MADPERFEQEIAAAKIPIEPDTTAWERFQRETEAWIDNIEKRLKTAFDVSPLVAKAQSLLDQTERRIATIPQDQERKESAWERRPFEQQDFRQTPSMMEIRGRDPTQAEANAIFDRMEEQHDMRRIRDDVSQILQILQERREGA